MNTNNRPHNSDGHDSNTPSFSTSFQDSAFYDFIDQSIHQGGSRDSEVPHSEDSQHEQPARGNIEVEVPVRPDQSQGHGGDDDLDDLDDFELDSQTMKQLDQVEEMFYSTQQSQFCQAQ
ncbi:hypothetical protein EV182_007198, partial [Spiromyces aspiralis]